MSAALGSELLASVLLLPVVVGWAYMLVRAVGLLGLLWVVEEVEVGWGVVREGVVVVSVGAREGWREGAPE